MVQDLDVNWLALGKSLVFLFPLLTRFRKRALKTSDFQKYHTDNLETETKQRNSHLGNTQPNAE